MSRQKPPINRQRRAVLTSPLLRKSAIHQQSRKAIRRDDKMALRKQWRPQSKPGLFVLRAPLLPLPGPACG